MDENVSKDAVQNAAQPMILCENLVKIYKTKDSEVLALQGLELTVEKGELLAIIGNSGSGKSTFLNMKSENCSRNFLRMLFLPGGVN